MNDQQTLHLRQEFQLKCFSTNHAVKKEAFEKLQVIFT